MDRTPIDGFFMAVATAAAGLLAAVRWTQAKGVDFGAPMVSTQAGAFPPGLVTNVFRGFDVCLLSTAPMALGFSPFWSLLIAGIAALILLNSMDAESLRARQAEQQKLLAQQKKQREAEQATAKATQALNSSPALTPTRGHRRFCAVTRGWIRARDPRDCQASPLAERVFDSMAS